MSGKNPYEHFNKYIIRTPLLPLEFITELTKSKHISYSDLQLLLQNPLINEAIFIASPNLYYETRKWFNGNPAKGNKSEKKIQKLSNACLRYLLRMSTRCTPFGIFAGFSTGKFADNTEINRQSAVNIKRHTRLDMNYLCALAYDSVKQPFIRENILFYPNSSIYQIGDFIRYVEYEYIEASRIHHIAEVDNSIYLQNILSKAKKGAKLDNLITILVDENIDADDARDFIYELVESQLLVSEMEPNVTGDDFHDRLLERFKSFEDNDYSKRVTTILSYIKDKFKKIKTGHIDNYISEYESISRELKQLDTNYRLNFLFQTDLEIPYDSCFLKYEIAEDIKIALTILNKLNPKSPENNMSKFKAAFVERFDSEEVPLLFALDNESGVGYLQDETGDVAPLVDDLFLPESKQVFPVVQCSKIQSFLHNVYIRSLLENEKTVEIFDDDLIGLHEKWDDLPETLSVLTQIIGSSKNEKPDIFIKSAGGSTAANLIGRFCNSDSVALSLVKEIIDCDEKNNGDVIYAEIVHLPESRTGNILARPTLRDYEIPYLAKSGINIDNQIRLDDLYISVRGDQVILRSDSLNKTVIPRLTSAHNYSFNSLPVYQFLCDLQVQNLRGGLNFNWGPLADQYQFLPGIRYRNIILSRPTWNIKKTDIKHILIKSNESERIAAFNMLVKKFALPKEVLLCENDNELYLNLENNNCIGILLDQVKTQNNFVLTEFLFDPDDLIVNTQEGGTTNEFVFAFHKRKDQN